MFDLLFFLFVLLPLRSDGQSCYARICTEVIAIFSNNVFTPWHFFTSFFISTYRFKISFFFTKENVKNRKSLSSSKTNYRHLINPILCLLIFSNYLSPSAAICIPFQPELFWGTGNTASEFDFRFSYHYSSLTLLLLWSTSVFSI